MLDSFFRLGGSNCSCDSGELVRVESVGDALGVPERVESVPWDCARVLCWGFCGVSSGRGLVAIVSAGMSNL